MEIILGANIGFVTIALHAQYNKNRNGNGHRSNATPVAETLQSAENAAPVQKTQRKRLNASPVAKNLAKCPECEPCRGNATQGLKHEFCRKIFRIPVDKITHDC